MDLYNQLDRINATPAEVESVQDAIFNGSFDMGDCDECLFGVIGRERGKMYHDIALGDGSNSSTFSAVELWAMHNARETDEVYPLIDQWLAEWLSNRTTTTTIISFDDTLL